MAKTTILKERGTGEVMYPQTLAKLVQTSDGKNVDEGLEAAKMQLFIDMWNNAAGSYGRYNPDTKFFELNGLTDITYEEAIVILQAGKINRTYPQTVYEGSSIRTNIPNSSTAGIKESDGCFHSCTKLEVANAKLFYSSPYLFYRCKKLKRICTKEAPMYDISAKCTTTTFYDCKSLEEIYGTIRSSSNLYFNDSPLIKLNCFVLLITNALNAVPITITVHPDVYAKLTDINNTEWNALLTQAAEKQITFATV